MNLTEFREQFPLADRYVFLNHSGVSPIATRTAGAIQEMVEKMRAGNALIDADRLLSETKESIQRLIKARSTGEIAVVQSTGHALNIVAHSLPMKPGDNVVFTDMEYPSNAYPWMNLRLKGIEARIVPHRAGGLHLPDLMEFVDGRTRVVAASSVEFLSGFKNDIRSIGQFCRERGIAFVVDAIQSLGSIPMDVEANYVDALATSGYKLLLGPTGIGFLYVRQELIGGMEPVFAGAHSVVDYQTFLPYHLDFLPDAGRFETSRAGFAGEVGLQAAIELLLEVGIENIERQTMRLADLLIAHLQSFRDVTILTDLTPHHRSAIVSFTTPDPQSTYQVLTDNNIRCALRGDHHGTQFVRISPHGYNVEPEIHRVAEVLKTMWN